MVKELHSGELLISFLILMLTIGLTMPALIGNITAALTGALKILDAETGLNSVTLGNTTAPMPLGGYNFTVDVFLYGAVNNLAAYQAYITFNNTILTCTAAWIPENNQSFVFYGQMIVPVTDILNSESYAIAGASSFVVVDVTESALLCKFNFTARRTGSTTIQLLKGSDQSVLINEDNIRIGPSTTEDFTVDVLASSSPPVASFTFSPTAPKANQTTTFDASESYDPDGGDITNYTWDFSDGTPVSNVNVSTIAHTYTQNGLYSVNLTVTDDEGNMTSVVKDVPVGTAPVAAFTFSPVAVSINQTVTFNATASSDADGTIVSYGWNFGDGNTTSVTNPTITHSYLSNGLKTVKLTVTDNDDLFNSIVKNVTVGIPPTANFTYSPLEPIAGDVVTFDASSSEDPDGNITQYIWIFGDEIGLTPTPTTTNESTITHTYIGEGNHTVSLTVVDNDGLQSDPYTHKVEVSPKPTGPQGFDWTWYIVIAVVLIIVVIVAAILLKRRPKKEAKPSEI
jgi:PKD repeat protein